jgi:predicted GNAT family acetyltransferase
MTWTLTSSLDEFLAGAGEFLHANPAHNTVLLTLADRLAKDGPHTFGPREPRFGWHGSPVDGAFLHTPPFALRFGQVLPEAAAELAALLHAQDAELEAVGGWRSAAEAFARTWEQLAEVTGAVHVNERLYRLAELQPPSPAPAGHARPPAAADRELLVDWCEAFMKEVHENRQMDYGAWVDRRVADGDLLIWEDGSRPVAFAACSPVIAGMSRIGPVYTPPEQRGHGYASGVVAEVSAYALARGAREVLLFTDLANPTSNSIYQKLGYRPVDDSVVFDFSR